ncbi:MAG: hypothetical protein HKO59_01190 [Phycisphaerales bacterium]|nr:hypothetical protein [Phycisphaerales bacterium]
MTRRHARWVGGIVTLLLVGVVAGWIIRGVVRNRTATPAPVVDYGARMEALAAAAGSGGADGWPALTRALEQFETIETAMASDQPSTPGFGSPPIGPRRIARRLLDSGLPATLDAVAAADHFVRPAGTTAWSLVNTDSSKAARSLSRVLTAAMNAAHEAGDRVARDRAFEWALAVARAHANQPTIHDRLTAGAVAAHALETLRSQVHANGLDEDAADVLDAVMDRQLAWPAYATALEGERLSVHNLIQLMFTDDGHGDGRFSPDRASVAFGGTPRQNPFAGIGGVFLASRVETTAIVDTYIDRLIADAACLPPARTFDSDDFLDDYGRRYVLVRAMLPGMAHAVRVDDKHALQVAATRVVLAIERFRSRHDALPGTLDDLGSVMGVVPVDPLHGGPLVYRRDPARVGGYVLYSTGYDATDDSADLPAVRTGGATHDGKDVLLTP